MGPIDELTILKTGVMGKKSQNSQKDESDSAAELALNMNGLESWLWGAACSIRGAVDAPKFKDYILPLIFVKRLSDVFDDEINRLAATFGDRDTAFELVQEDHSLVRFYLPPKTSWAEIRKLTGNIGQRLTNVVRAVAKANPSLQGVIDIVDFNATVSGQRIVEDGRLSTLIEILSQQRLGLDDVEPDILGRAYEYLLRKFAEGQGQSAGEFFTPKEVGWLIARLLRPKEGQDVYDPACGSAGLLIKAQLILNHSAKTVRRPLHLHGQERIHTTFAIARMNMIIHDMEGEIALGDTLRKPKFLQGAKLQTFDLVAANPMWNQDGYATDFYESDAYGRFAFGYSPASNADWGWVQHMLHSLKPQGRAAIVLDTNAVNRGSGAKGKNKERDVRKQFVEKDLIECVILLPENLFYNTGAPGILLLLNRNKAKSRSRRILLINLSQHFEKGSPKNFLPEHAIDKTVDAFTQGKEEEGFSTWLSLKEARNLDYDLSPARHIAPLRREQTISVQLAAEELSRFAQLRARIATQRQTSVALLRSRRTATLVQPTPIGPIPKSWKLVPINALIAETKSGDWGRDPESDNSEDLVLCSVVKGTNFRDVEAFNLLHVPERLIKKKTYENRKPRVGDLLIEISGGGKYQATGRVLYISEELLGLESIPLFFSNFLKLLRPDTKRVEPRFLYHCWRMLYLQGRTEIYEKQPTNIKNFKYRDFLESERVPDLRRAEQIAIARVLDELQLESLAAAREMSALDELDRVALYDTLTGRYRPEADGG